MVTKRLITVAFLLLVSPLCRYSFAGVVINYDFNNQSFGSLTAGSYWTIQPSSGPDDSYSARLEYSNASSDWGKSLTLDVSNLESNEFYIEFDVKVEGNPAGGSKFIKLFGDATPSRNNVTLRMNYLGGDQSDVQFNGDSQCAAHYEEWGKVYCATKVVQTSTIDMKGQWGHYKAWVKRASPGVSDGEVKVWWNGELKAHFSSMDSNPASYFDPTPGFYSIDFGGYNFASLNGGADGYFADGITPTWYLWIDNLVVSTTAKDLARRLSLGGRPIKLVEPGP